MLSKGRTTAVAKIEAMNKALNNFYEKVCQKLKRLHWSVGICITEAVEHSFVVEVIRSR